MVHGHPESPLFGAIKFDTPGPGVLLRREGPRERSGRRVGWIPPGRGDRKRSDDRHPPTGDDLHFDIFESEPKRIHGGLHHPTSRGHNRPYLLRPWIVAFPFTSFLSPKNGGGPQKDAAKHVDKNARPFVGGAPRSEQSLAWGISGTAIGHLEVYWFAHRQNAPMSISKMMCQLKGG